MVAEGSGERGTGLRRADCGALKERLRLQFAKVIPEFDDLDMLGIVGTSQIGRLGYSSSDDIDESMPETELAPAYDLVATQPYIPHDTMALTMEGSKNFLIDNA